MLQSSNLSSSLNELSDTDEYFSFAESVPCHLNSLDLIFLLQVCEVYKLHRETFYLSQDYFDRFMATQDNVLKSTLQLVGISSLFIAAKMEASLIFILNCI